jgi:predicted nucleotidyltransferase
MDKSTIMAKLREHEGELKAAGVEHLFLHGSYAGGRLSATCRMWMS